MSDRYRDIVIDALQQRLAGAGAQPNWVMRAFETLRKDEEAFGTLNGLLQKAEADLAVARARVSELEFEVESLVRKLAEGKAAELETALREQAATLPVPEVEIKGTEGTEEVPAVAPRTQLHVAQQKALDAKRARGAERVAAGKKTCSLCKQEKPLDEFGKNARLLDGHSGQCKKCVKDRYGSHPGKPDAPADVPAEMPEAVEAVVVVVDRSDQPDGSDDSEGGAAAGAEVDAPVGNPALVAVEELPLDERIDALREEISVVMDAGLAIDKERRAAMMRTYGVTAQTLDGVLGELVRKRADAAERRRPASMGGGEEGKKGGDGTAPAERNGHGERGPSRYQELLNDVERQVMQEIGLIRSRGTRLGNAVRYDLQRKYGLTKEQVDALCERQDRVEMEEYAARKRAGRKPVVATPTGHVV